jgi:3-dehydroquinate dehydratase type I
MGSPKICVVVTARDTEGVVETIGRVEDYSPDLIEIRLDYLEGPCDLEGIRGASGLPLIATNRGMDQGGISPHTDSERMKPVIRACEAGFDYADIELALPQADQIADKVKDLGAKAIISHHDFSGTPPRERLDEIMTGMLGAGADICKIVGTATSQGDNLMYLNLIQENPSVSLVSFGMGRTGLLSRVFSPLLGAPYTYASSEAGRESAPGQLTVQELRQIYSIMGV